MADSVPAGPPPTYQDATGGSSSSRPAAQSGSSNLTVPGRSEKNGGIPASARRSMEDETRPLPKGWVRTFDPESHHHFYVDTTKDPPRSIWVHPHDDEKYLSTLSSEERERIEEESRGRGAPMSHDDIIAANSDDDDNMASPSGGTKDGELPPRPEGKSGDGRSFGRKWKDKITGTTHEEREAQRRKRAEQERKMYEQHQIIRRAMVEAQQTGKPVHIGKDSSGKDVYVEPPNYSSGYGGYGGGYGYSPYGGGYGGYGGGGGTYDTPNARYIRPPNPYYRPYGYGYGGGYGYPLAGGLLGGLLLTDLLI